MKGERNHEKKKLCSAVLCAAMCASLLWTAGCGSSGSEVQEAETTETSEEAAASSDAAASGNAGAPTATDMGADASGDSLALADITVNAAFFEGVGTETYGCAEAFDYETASEDALNITEGEETVDGLQLLYWDGSAIQNSGNAVMTVRNSYIWGDTIYVTEPLAGNPGNLLVAGNIRTTLGLGNSQSYYVNSTVVSRNWAALSTDGAEPADEAGEKELSLYAYGTEAVTLSGGYGAYSDLFCNLYSFGSHIQAAEIGIISGTYGRVTIGTIADGEADADMSAVLTDADKETRADKTLGSLIEGGRNAIMIHSVNLPPYWEYDGYSQEELPLYSTEITANGSVLKTNLSLDRGVSYDAQKQAYIDHTEGSVILIKSTNVEMELTDCEVIADAAGTGYLMQTVYNNDTMFMNAVPDG